MAKVLLGVAATAVMVVGGVMDPGRRYIYLFFTLLGLIFTYRAFIAWEEKRRVTAGGSS
jgi:hypothetical protein